MAALRNWKMDNVLNFVYDDWPIEKEFPNANRPKNINFIQSGHDENLPWEVSYKTMAIFQNTIIKNHKIDEVERNPNKIFYYHIWHRLPISHYLNNDILPVDNNILELLKIHKNLNLIFMNEVEVDSKYSLQKLNDMLLQNEVDVSKVWVINNNQKLQYWKNELNINLNVHSCKMLPQMFPNEQPGKWKLDKEDGSFFMCHNRTPRPHRYALLCLLKYNNLLSDTNWSLINGWQSDKVNVTIRYSSLFSKEDIDTFKYEIEYFENINTAKSKYETDYTNFDVKYNQVVFNNINTYENSYVNITTETNFEDEAIHISEKSLKPFYYFQFPLILASYHHIKYLKDVYAFDLFEDIINYDYDNIQNNRDRLFTFIEEINRIHNNKELFIEFYKNNKERFIKNHNILANYKNEHDYNFFKQLAK